jgi:hypothetical protein
MSDALSGRTLALLVDHRSLSAFTAHFAALQERLATPGQLPRADGAPSRPQRGAPPGQGTLPPAGAPAPAAASPPGGSGRSRPPRADARGAAGSRSSAAAAGRPRSGGAKAAAAPLGAHPERQWAPPPGSAGAFLAVAPRAPQRRPDPPQSITDLTVALADDRGLAMRRRPRDEPARGDTDAMPNRASSRGDPPTASGRAAPDPWASWQPSSRRRTSARERSPPPTGTPNRRRRRSENPGASR